MAKQVMKASIEVIGATDLDEVLEAMGTKQARLLTRGIVQGIASGIVKDMRQNAPSKTGTLRKAIKAKRDRIIDKDKPTSRVIIERGGGATHDAYYWRFVEFGAEKSTKKHSHATGERPFARPAVARARANMAELYRQEFFNKLASKFKRDRKKISALR